MLCLLNLLLLIKIIFPSFSFDDFLSRPIVLQNILQFLDLSDCFLIVLPNFLLFISYKLEVRAGGLIRFRLNTFGKNSLQVIEIYFSIWLASLQTYLPAFLSHTIGLVYLCNKILWRDQYQLDIEATNTSKTVPALKEINEGNSTFSHQFIYSHQIYLLTARRARYHARWWGYNSKQKQIWSLPPRNLQSSK